MSERRMKDQTAAVLRLLRARGADGVTPAEAREQLACDRLAARVWELVHWHGFAIATYRERTPIGATYARYVLTETPAFVPTTGTQGELFA